MNEYLKERLLRVRQQADQLSERVEELMMELLVNGDGGEGFGRARE